MTENGRLDISAIDDLPELLWLIAEHEVDIIDAVPISQLLQQALDDGLVHWPSPDEEQFCLKLTTAGRLRIGLPPLAPSDTDGADLLRAMGRRAFRRFIFGPL